MNYLIIVSEAIALLCLKLAAFAVPVYIGHLLLDLICKLAKKGGENE
ncbi:hypothetical protein [Rubritalea marina]|nr:hypothetical protein [Rubritalea marina]